MFLIDSHCHLNQLDYENIHKDVSDVLRKAQKKGVQLVLSVSTDLLDYENMIECIGSRKDVLFSCGVHPVNLCNANIFDRIKLQNLSSNTNVVAIGETGLDYYYYKNKKDIQKEAFREHICIAKNLNKPLIVHSRHAIADTICILKEEHAEQCSGVLHCFSEDIDSVRSLLNINFYISLSGIITFSNSDILKKSVQYIPLDRLLLETDSPFLAPLPYRGQENQPAYVYEIARYIARIRNVSIDQLASITTENFHQLFHILSN